MSVEDELRAAARRAHEAALDSQDARRTLDDSWSTARASALAHAAACAEEMDEAIEVFLKLMRRAGNPGLGGRFGRRRSWEILHVPYRYEVEEARWALNTSGKWWALNGWDGYPRQILTELVTKSFDARADWRERNIPPPDIKPQLDGLVDALKRALAETLGRHGVVT